MSKEAVMQDNQVETTESTDAVSISGIRDCMRKHPALSKLLLALGATTTLVAAKLETADAASWNRATQVNTGKLRDDAKNLYASAQQDRNEAAAAQARIDANNREKAKTLEEMKAIVDRIKREKGLK
ncbi:MAG: hypothetical protein WC304_03810 [Candidatus Gracilibacteria bacterium]|jgi:cell division septum initiation protein DivIVA